MSRFSTTVTSGAVVALLATFSMTAPSFAAGKKMHAHKSMAMRHRARPARMATMPPMAAPASVHNGHGNPFADGDIFGGTGPTRPAQTAGYSTGGLFGGGGVLGTGVLSGQGTFGLGVLGL